MYRPERQKPELTSSHFDWHRETMTDMATCLYIAGAKRLAPSVVLLLADYDEQGKVQGHAFRLIDLAQTVEGPEDKRLAVGAALMNKAVVERDDVLLAGFMFDEIASSDTLRLNLMIRSHTQTRDQSRLVGRVDGGFRLVPQ